MYLVVKRRLNPTYQADYFLCCAVNMTDEVAPVTVIKKEPEILMDASLIYLARHIASEGMNYLEFGMRLNLPTTTLVNIVNKVSEYGFQDEQFKNSVAERSLLLWKQHTSESKTKDRVKTLEKALREMNKNEIADMILEKHAQNQALTPDCFQIST